MASYQGFAQRKGRHVTQCEADGDCLQGPAAPQARPGLLGRRVSQVGSETLAFIEMSMQAWQGLRALHREGERV